MDPLPWYGFDFSRVVSGPPIDFSAKTREVVRRINEATEGLLEKWVSDGLPLERAEPKYEIGQLTDDHKLPVRVWVEWRELPGDVTIEL